MAKVSVIIPIYNVEKYLRECLDSVINQTLKDIEIICVNGGSTDGSRAILQEYADKDDRIKIIDQENGGLSHARNVGIKEATGEYIGFVDSDDWIDLDFYDELYNAAEKHEADIAVGEIYRTDGKYIVKYEKYTSATNIKKKYILTCVPKHNYVWNKLYRRITLLRSQVKFDEGMNFEDIEFTHKIVYYSSKLVTVPEVRYFYRNTEASIVNLKNEKNDHDHIKAVKRAQKFVKKHCLQVNPSRYGYLEKTIYKIFGVPLLVVKSNYLYKKYLILGLLPILNKISYNKGDQD